jgi:molybdate/tungstate transport system substrate-binding protein
VKEATPAKPTVLSGKLTVRHAGSLTPMCAEVHKAFSQLHPDVNIVDVGGGGVQMARETASKRDCDVYASVDYSNIPNLLIPDLAEWYVIFASTGFVLRYTDKSKYADELTPENWFDIVQRDDVGFWRSNPEGDPAGYRSLMVLQLAEKWYGVPGLYERVAAKSGKQFLSFETLPLRDAGYCFSYSSHLMSGKALNLPDQINLSSADHADYYRQASVTIPSLKPGGKVTMRGERIRIGLTIPSTCTNVDAAVAWTHLLLSETGRAAIEHVGKVPIKPIFGGDLSKIPAELKEYTA